MILATAFAVLLADPPAPAPPKGSTALPAPILLKLDKAKWQTALDQVALPLGLQVRLDVEPPGTVTYTDNAPRPPAEALDILHGILLDRGVALVKRDAMLVALRLADQAHYSHAPFAPAEEVRTRKDSLMTFTTIKLNSLLAQDCKAELSGFLSPRGRMIDTALGNRVAVWDRCDNLRALISALDLIDPPGQGAAAPFKAYPFRFGKASEAANIARELLGLRIEENEGVPGSISDLAGQTFTRRNMRRAGRMFAPGVTDLFTGGGDGGGGSEKDSKVRITVDTDTNTVYVHGPFDKLQYLDPLLKALDAPPMPGQRPETRMDLRVFPVTTGEGNAVAAKLKQALGGIPGMVIAGANDKVIVKGPADRIAEIGAMFQKLNPASVQYAAFPTGEASARSVAKQLALLFESDPEAARPLLASSGGDDQLVVRGTAAQVARIQGMMKSYSAGLAVEKVAPVKLPAPAAK